MFTILTVSLMTKPCFLLLSKTIMYDSWSMFTILTVSLMTKPCFLLRGLCMTVGVCLLY